MESQPVIEAVSETPGQELPKSAEDSKTTKDASPNIFLDAFLKGFCSTNSSAREETSSGLPDIMELLMKHLPTLMGAFSVSSDRIGRVEPSWRRKSNTLVVQIIIGKLSFVITRDKKDRYKISFKQETIFQTKKMNASELYRFINVLTDVRTENIHFTIIFNDSTLDNRTLESVDFDKKTLKKTLRYFLCLL